MEHLLLSCRRHIALREECWTDEDGRKRRITDLRDILSTHALAMKAAQFMIQTRLLEQLRAVYTDEQQMAETG